MSPSAGASSRQQQREAPPMSSETNYLNYDYPFESVEGYLFTALSDQTPLDPSLPGTPYPGQQYHGMTYLDTLTSESQSPSGSVYDDVYQGQHGQFPSVSPSPEQGAETSASAQKSKPAPKRKRVNRYKNASPETVERRRDQNRTAQQHYRQRKDKLIEDLKNDVETAAKENASLRSENGMLKIRLANSEATCRVLAAAQPSPIGLTMPMSGQDSLAMGSFGYHHVGESFLPVPEPGGQLISADGWHASV